ncbi:RB1-inducible coiled-coil protein 1-like [Peromyscus californicus insignis]|uniref:RB1-inducible coiled-coil protein 1-like n=1 Tax=Peromyscus californicus insignis TaxID=564181 RepID=UPI0022A7DC00|nr:RB1-inducible coiled-coil protein 1-like [Peromyscus californicus insignis]
MPYHRLNFELEMLEMEHKQVMSALQKLPMEISDALNKCKGLIEETEYFSYLHGRFLQECNHLKKNVRTLMIQNIQLWKEQIELQKTCEEVKKLLKEAHEKICDPCAEQLQVQENLEERLKDMLKQKELVTQQRDLAEKLQHHFNVSEMRSENLQPELEHVTPQDERLLQTELLEQEQKVSQLNFELEMLEMEHKQVMSALQKIPMEISDALDKCKGLIEETESFSYLNGRVLRECSQLKRNVHVLRLQNTQLWKEQIELQKTCEEVKKLLKEAHEKICDPCAEQQQNRFPLIVVQSAVFLKSTAGITRVAPSQCSTFTEQEQEQEMKKLEKLTIRLHDMECERNELRGILANYTNKYLNNRLNFELEMLEMEHKQVMSGLQKLPMEISDALNKCKGLIEETEIFSYLHGRFLQECNHLKKNVRVLTIQSTQLWKEQIELQKTCEAVKKLLKEAHEKICDPCADQQQEQENLEETLKDLLKQKELVTQQRDLAEKLQHHFNVSEMRVNFELEMLEMEHKQVMSYLQKLPMEISDSLDKCKGLIEETEYFSYLNGRVLRECSQLKKNVHVLRLQNIQLWKEQIELQKTCEEVKKLLKEAHEKICDPCAEQQQEQESLDGRLKDLLKQNELVTVQMDLAEKLQHHFSVSEMRSENLQYDLEHVTAQDESLLQTELLQQEQEVSQARTTRVAPSQCSTFTEQEQEQEMKKLEKLTIRLHDMECERNELRGILANYTNKDLNNRLNFELEMLEMEHKQVMSALQKLPMEISDALNKCKGLIEETEYFSYLHGRFLQECNHLKRNVRVLTIQNTQLWKEQIELQKTCEEVKKLLKEAHEKICDPCAEQQQEQENLEERPKDLLKQKELVTQQRDLAEKLQHHFNVSEMRSENLHHKLEHVTAQDESLLQKELLEQEQEVSQARTTRVAPSQCSTFTEQEQEQEMKKLEKLTIRLHDMECERNEMRGILANYTNKDLNNRLNFELEMLEVEHKQVMSALQKLPMEISDALNKCKGLIEETEYFSYLHGWFLQECNHLKKNVRVLTIQNTQLWKEQIELQKTCEEVKKLLKEAHEKICDPCAEQQQEQENLEERMKDLLKQKELATQQRDLTEKLQQHFNVSEMRSENLQHELEHVTAQDESLLHTELLEQEQEVSQASEPPLHSNPCNHGIHGDWGLLTLASNVNRPNFV